MSAVCLSPGHPGFAGVSSPGPGHVRVLSSVSLHAVSSLPQNRVRVSGKQQGPRLRWRPGDVLGPGAPGERCREAL